MRQTRSHGAPPAHPTDLSGLAFLDDDRDRPVAVREVEHSLAGFRVFLHVVLDEVHSAPLQVLTGGLAVGTTGFWTMCPPYAACALILSLREELIVPQIVMGYDGAAAFVCREE